MKNMITKKQEYTPLELYIHVPFCVKKCNYCDFLSAPSGALTKERYFKALQEEIRSYAGRMDEYKVVSVFIGGGTPSSVAADYLKEVLDTVREVFVLAKGEEVPEITVEVNPGTVDYDKLMTYREAGINRISFGLQSTLDHELKLLGRIHDYEQFLENYSLARSIGFNNINVDLMSALPGQTLQDWEITLQRIAELNPEHISAYSLIIEEGTPFYERYGEGKPEAGKLPEEETDRLMYARTKEILKDYGYHRYEISNYSRKGYECRHNQGYWTGIPYLGLGLGASSCLWNTRFQNTTELEEYIQACMKECNHSENVTIASKAKDQTNVPRGIPGIRRELQELSRKAQMEEFMFLGLRLTKGISREEFTVRFGQEIEEIYGKVIEGLKDKGLLDESMGLLYLTEYGIDVSNQVLAEFLLD